MMLLILSLLSVSLEHVSLQAIQDITRNRDIDPEEIVSLIFEKIDVKGEGEMTLEEFIEGAKGHDDIMEMLKTLMDLTPVGEEQREQGIVTCGAQDQEPEGQDGNEDGLLMHMPAKHEGAQSTEQQAAQKTPSAQRTVPYQRHSWLREILRERED
ncbi:hypothetical protein INR49_032277 [Caranx melampygus]|nr:hypothetical protein INR49_032277 [Caranx melampygus]